MRRALPTRDILEIQPVQAEALQHLSESGREGTFVFKAGDFTAEVAGDPAQENYLAPGSAPDGSAGAWVRQTARVVDGPMINLADSFDPDRVEGVTDDTAVAQAALTAMGGAGNLVLPAGRYRITAKLLGTIGLNITGSGDGTVLVVESSELIEFSGGEDYATSRISNLTIVADNPPPGTDTAGIKFNAVRAERQSFYMDGVTMRSSDGLTRTNGFDNYIWLHDAFSAVLSDLHLDGQFNAAANPVGQYQQNALRTTGVTTGVVWRDSQVYAFYRGFYLTGGTNEGPRVSGVDMVGVYYGIDAPSYNRPGFWLSSVHINSVKRAVYVEGATDFSASQLWLYRAATFYTDATDWTGVHLKSCLARTSLSQVNTSLSITSDTQYGIRLEDCLGVAVSTCQLSQVNRAIFHAGTNSHVTYDAITFNGLGATGIGFTTTATDSHVRIGSHVFRGTFASKYAFAATPQSMVVEYGRLAYQGVTSSASLVAAGTATLIPGDSQQFEVFNFGAGAGAFTYNIDLSATNAVNGDYFDLRIAMPASTNPTVRVRNQAGATLRTFNTAVATKYIARFVYILGGWGIGWIVASET